MPPLLVIGLSILGGLALLLILAMFAAGFIALIGPPDAFDIEIESERLEQTARERK